jgi:hypothetical protein
LDVFLAGNFFAILDYVYREKYWPGDSEAKWSHDEEELTLHGWYQGRRLLIVRSAAQENQM